MKKIDWVRKLTSRKWWISIITLISGLILAFGIGEDTTTTITGCVMALASAISYTIGEGFTDAASVQNEKTQNYINHACVPFANPLTKDSEDKSDDDIK